ncbi:MAG: methyltransferase domain-containing protein [Armatimonadota bacterium]
MSATVSENRWDRFVPYTPRDVEEFVSAGVDRVVVQRVRLERDRQSLFTADVFLYHRQLKRRMVWQFISVDVRNGILHLEFPTPFRNLPLAWQELLLRTLADALGAVQSNPQSAQGVIFNVGYSVPEDVPPLDGGGENRVAPGFAWNELYVHSAKRYLFAGEQVEGGCVLDMGCGVGYGAKILATRVRQVVAVDVDEYPLRYGELTYPDSSVQRVHIAPITAEQGLPFEKGCFDAVVCFEVIEHVPVEQMEPFFAEIARVMKPDGVLILSTPNKHIYINYPTPHHVSLMTLEEFRRLLESRFDRVQLFGQVRARGLPHTAMEFEIVPVADEGQEIYVAVCKGYEGDTRPIVLPPPTVWQAHTPEEFTSQDRLPISVIVHTRNEEHNIAECLDRVKNWAGEIIVMDMESTDRTVEIARRYTDRVYNHPLIHDFDEARNASAQHARYEWILYVDADERVPSALVDALRQLLPTIDANVAAVKLTYKNYFLGKWIRHAGQWYPGYKAPMLLRKGRFRWLGAAHEGVHVQGQILHFPPDNPDCAIEHYSVPTLDHFIRKLAHYSLSAGRQMLEQNADCSWQTLASAMGTAFRYYYDQTQGYKDGGHGFLLSVCSMVSALMDQVRHAELRLREGWAGDALLPSSAEEFLRFAADVAAGKIAVEQRKISHILNISASDTLRSSPPSWWERLWRRLQRQASGRVALIGAANTTLMYGWTKVDIGANALIAFGDDWREAVSSLEEGGMFLVGVPLIPQDPHTWREEIESAFGATAHLIDPELTSNWCFAFGWKGQKVEPVRRRVLMLTHQRALEMLGGGETQLFETLIALRDEGVVADVSASMRLPQEPYDLIHVFSLYHADKVERLERTDKPAVVSTIFRDNSAFYPVAVGAAVFRQAEESQVERALQAWKEGRLRVEGVDAQSLDEPEQVRQVKRRIIERVQLLLPNCRWEHSSLRRYFRLGYKPVRIVPNAISPERFIRATPDAFVERFGLRDFMLCAARVEPFKNQLMLIWALRDTGIPLVLAGNISDAEYGTLCRRWAGENVHFVGELPPNLLASAYAAARVHAMPSWAETPGLTTLEAALAGCAVVVGNRGAEREYFGDFAYYCNPADVDSVREAVLSAWNDNNPARREAFREHILQHYTWANTAQATAEAYEQLLRGQRTVLAMPDWRDVDTWQPLVKQYLQEHQPGDGWLLQVYAGVLSAFSAESAYNLLAQYIASLGYSPENCADIEVIDELPENAYGRVVLTGGRYDSVLQTRYGTQCKYPQKKAA